MKIAILLIIYMIFSLPAKSQEQSKKIKIYKAKVTLLNNKNPFKGTFYSVEDSSITLKNSYVKDNIQRVTYTTILIEDIKEIKIRRLGKVGRSMAIGTLSGLGLAVTIGVLEGPDDCLKTDWCQDVGEKVTMYGFFLVPTGLVIGAIIGSPSKKFGIYGTMQNYNVNKSKFIQYATFKEYNSSETGPINE